MSWAINAARSRQKDVAPGTSGFFQNELKISTMASLDNSKSIYESVSSHIDHLNLLREKILEGSSRESVWGHLLDLKEVELNQLAADDEASHHLLSINNQSDPLGELKSRPPSSNQSSEEKQVKDKPGTLKYNHHSSPPTEARLIQRRNQRIQSSLRNPSSPASKTDHENVNESSEYPVPPATLPLSSSSPAKESRNDNLPTTSPNVDLSFIPIASTINPNKAITKSSASPSSSVILSKHNPKHASTSLLPRLSSVSQNDSTKIEMKKPSILSSDSKHNPNGNDDDYSDDLDNSFQAISSAIRKSFAGKVSLGNISKPLSSDSKNNIDSNDSGNPSSRYDDKHSGSIGNIPTSSFNNKRSHEARQTISNMNRTPKRSSGYVSLPSREPLSGFSASIVHRSNGKSLNSSVKLFENLEDSKRDKLISEDNPNPDSHKKNSIHPSIIDSNYIRHSMKGRASMKNLIFEPKPEDNKLIPKQQKSEVSTADKEDKNTNLHDKNYQTASILRQNLFTPRESLILPQNKNASSSSVNDFLRRSRNVFMNNELRFSQGGLQSYKNDKNYQAYSSLEHETTDKASDSKVSHVERPFQSLQKTDSKTRSSSAYGLRSPTRDYSQYKPLYLRKPTLDSKKGPSPRKLSPVNATSVRASSPTRAKSSMKTNFSISKSKSPRRTRSPIRRISTASTSKSESRSPTRYSTRAETSEQIRGSPTDYSTGLRLSKLKRLSENREAEVVSRLLTPTTSSAAKIVKSPLKNLKVDAERKLGSALDNPVLDHSGNEKLTSHINSTNGTPVSLDSTNKKHNTLPNNDETTNTRAPKTRLNHKKSLMAERNEAAAHRTKQKLVLSSSHKSDLKQTNLVPHKLQSPSTVRLADKKRPAKAPTKGLSLTSSTTLNVNRQQDKTGEIPQSTQKNKLEPAAKLSLKEVNLKPTNKPNEMLASAESHSTRRGNAVPLPDAARGGKFTRDRKPISSSTIANPRRKIKNTDYILPNPKKPRHVVPSANPVSTESILDELPRTPTKDEPYTADNLPDIPSDDDTNQRDRKYFKNWAATPELQRILDEKRNVDPISIFGEVPPLNMDEIFESQASRFRGRASPNQTP